MCERKLRNADEKNLALNHEYQRYYNFAGNETIAGGGFIDQDLLHANREEEINAHARIGDATRLESMMKQSNTLDRGLNPQFAYENRGGVAYGFQGQNINSNSQRVEGEKMAFDRNSTLAPAFMFESKQPIDMGVNVNSLNHIRQEGEQLREAIARSQIPSGFHGNESNLNHPLANYQNTQANN